MYTSKTKESLLDISLPLTCWTYDKNSCVGIGNIRKYKQEIKHASQKHSLLKRRTSTITWYISSIHQQSTHPSMYLYAIYVNTRLCLWCTHKKKIDPNSSLSKKIYVIWFSLENMLVCFLGAKKQWKSLKYVKVI